MNIDNNGAAVLAYGLSSLSSLKRLILSSNRIGERGLYDLFGALVKCNLEEFRLSRNVLSVSALGLRSLSTLVRVRSLKTLNLYGNGIDDDGLQALVEGMASCCSLTEFDSITATGLTSLSSLFRDKNCSLRKLDLTGINLVDNGVIA